jgi:hypothetical protein
VPTTAAPASAPAAGPAPLALRVSVTVSPTDHRVREESRQFRWQSGVRRFENPARRGVEERVRDAERAFRQADADASERGARCQAARDAWTRAAQCAGCPEQNAVDVACREADAADDLRTRRQRELDDVRRELANTPATFEEPEFQEVLYTVRVHAWIVRYTADITVGAGGPVRTSGAFEVNDEEHAGNARGGLDADPLSPPGASWFHAALSSSLARQTADLASGDLAQRARERRGACVGDAPVWTGAWLECWAEATLWGGTEPRGLDLLVGTAHAQDRAYPAGAAWPAPSCL